MVTEHRSDAFQDRLIAKGLDAYATGDVHITTIPQGDGVIERWIDLARGDIRDACDCMSCVAWRKWTVR